MSDLSKPLYSLTVGEYIELNKKVFAEEAEKILHSKEQAEEPVKHDQDIIFIDEVLALTGYRKATLYSKVCRYEIPVISRRKPLTFSRKAIMQWLHDGKPNTIDQEADNYFNKL